MKKNNQRRPKPRPLQAPAARHEPPAQGGAARPAAAEREEGRVGIVSGTPADTFDEVSERKHDKWVAIFISVLAVLIAITLTGSNDAMKIAQQSGIQVNDNYAFYQAKLIRQGQLKIASDPLELKIQELPNLAEPGASSCWKTRRPITTRKSRGWSSTARTAGRSFWRGPKVARTCGISRLRSIRSTITRAPSANRDRAASASIITGARLLLGASGVVGLFGILLFLNGYTLVYGSPHQSYSKLEALQKALPLMHRWEALKIARCPIE